ncbi:hypothetical protein TNCV_941211, partial [Trichonephila clavipes]
GGYRRQFASSIRTQPRRWSRTFRPTHTHDEVTNFINTPHVQEIEPTTPTEVLSYVQRLKPRKSPGLDQISNQLWLTDWKIKVNASKSACLMFTSRPRLPVGLTPVQIFGQPVPWVRVAKYLGLFLDAKLTFAHHIEQTRKKRRLFMPFSNGLSPEGVNLRSGIRFFDKLPSVPNELIRNQPAYDPAVPSSQKRPRALLEHDFINFPQAKRLRV